MHFYKNSPVFLKKLDNGAITLCLKDGTELPCSRVAVQFDIDDITKATATIDIAGWFEDVE